MRIVSGGFEFEAGNIAQMSDDIHSLQPEKLSATEKARVIGVQADHDTPSSRSSVIAAVISVPPRPNSPVSIHRRMFLLMNRRWAK
jgi:hypothetical protein